MFLKNFDSLKYRKMDKSNYHATNLFSNGDINLFKKNLSKTSNSYCSLNFRVGQQRLEENRENIYTFKEKHNIIRLGQHQYENAVKCSSKIGGNMLFASDEDGIASRGSLKQFSISSTVPVIVIPLAVAVAAINKYITVVIFVTVIALIALTYYNKTKWKISSRCFCIWIFWSIVYLVLIFELTVPLIVLMPEENLLLVVLAMGGFCCLKRTYTLAALNNVVPDKLVNLAKGSAINSEDKKKSEALTRPTELFLGNNYFAELKSVDSQPPCKYCRKNILTEHCYICSSCVLKRHHYCYWLDCWIGKWNYRHYLFGLILTELALVLGIDLTLTAICHPLLVARFGVVQLMLPDNCTGVYDDYNLSVAFVTAMYATLIAVLIFFGLICQVHKVFKGNSIYCEQNI